ncbi:MAG: helix-turn-helix transcriptional regulator [Bacteroidales bacterium]|nr:helix-turn-helix transcriptional regulator [Bacteroidales bacterium]
MHKMFRNIVITLFLCVSLSPRVFAGTSGYIRGTLLLDNSWDRIVYISLIGTFEKEYTVSDNMITGSSPIDSLGRFTINLDNLPTGWSLLRLHVVKKGDPPASLIIGGLDENYCFIVANRDSKIEIHNTLGKPIFQNLSFSGAPYLKTMEYITNLSDYPNSIDYENSLIQKKFVEEVVSEKLKTIADTCKNPLVSLYSLYQTDFLSDYAKNPAFYKEYLSKWSNNNSSYFKSFRRQFPHSEKPVWPYIMIFLFIAAIISGTVFVRTRKSGKIKNLSVQERRIFELLKKGATNQEISDECNIELSTVKSHVSSIFSKLNIKSRKEAMNVKVK